MWHHHVEAYVPGSVRQRGGNSSARQAQNTAVIGSGGGDG